MKKLILIIGAIVIVALVVAGIYLYSPEPTPNGGGSSDEKHSYSKITYDDCAKEILDKAIEEAGNLKPASEEPIGAERTDERGRVWTKSDEINSWDFDGNPIPGAYAWKSPDSAGSLLTNDAVDEFPGGINYMPEDLDYSSCEKYIFTRNADMEQRFTEIMDEVIQEQSQKGISISVEEIEVLNLAGRLQGHIVLSCEKMNYEADREIIGTIADKLIAEYPNEFSEGSERDSWVDIQGCSESGSSPDGVNTYYHTTTWRISDGYYDSLI